MFPRSSGSAAQPYEGNPGARVVSPPCSVYTVVRTRPPPSSLAHPSCLLRVADAIIHRHIIYIYIYLTHIISTFSLYTMVKLIKPRRGVNKRIGAVTTIAAGEKTEAKFLCSLARWLERKRETQTKDGRKSPGVTGERSVFGRGEGWRLSIHFLRRFT